MSWNEEGSSWYEADATYEPPSREEFTTRADPVVIHSLRVPSPSVVSPAPKLPPLMLTLCTCAVVAAGSGDAPAGVSTGDCAARNVDAAASLLVISLVVTEAGAAPPPPPPAPAAAAATPPLAEVVGDVRVRYGGQEGGWMAIGREVLEVECGSVVSSGAEVPVRGWGCN